MADSLKDKLAGAYTREDTRAQDPLTRLRALEMEGGIQDATAPLAANTMMMGMAGGGQVAGWLNTLKSLMSFHQGNGGLSDVGNLAYNLATPYAPPIVRNLRNRFNLPEIRK